MRICYEHCIKLLTHCKAQTHTQTESLTWGTLPLWPPPLGRAERQPDRPALCSLWYTEELHYYIDFFYLEIGTPHPWMSIVVVCLVQVNTQNLIRWEILRRTFVNSLTSGREIIFPIAKGYLKDFDEIWCKETGNTFWYDLLLLWNWGFHLY